MTRTVPVSPDGERYLAMARGEKVPSPFMLRWLAPRIIGADADRWVMPARFSFVACCVFGACYTRSWAALFVPLGLAGLTVQVRAPVLVDLHAMAAALAGAVLVQNGYWYLGLPWCFVAGCTKETAPIFAAAWAWSPIPLLGMVAPAVRTLVAKPGPDTIPGDTLSDPVRKAVAVHRSQPFAWFVLPWGVLLAGTVGPTAQVVVVLALAYAQLLVAQDLVRLYMWAWPVLALRTFDVIPSRWWPVVVLAHLLNPWKGQGW